MKYVPSNEGNTSVQMSARKFGFGQEHQLKSCGKRHAFCKECKPEAAFGNFCAPGCDCGRHSRIHPEDCTCAWHGAPNKLAIDERLRRRSRNRGQAIRISLVAAGRWEDECSKCGLGPEWQEESLVLQLDHIDGNKTNWEVENLRLLCPNCHTQTPTFGSKNRAS